MRPRVVVVGDVVLDRDVDGRSERLCPDAPVPVVDVGARRDSPGAAGLTALLCTAGGADVTLVAPVADDAAGLSLREGLAGVRLVALGHEGPTRRKTRVRSDGQSLVRLDDGGPGRPTHVPVDAVRAALDPADVVVVSDYGAGVTRDADIRALVAEVVRSGTPVVWDPHPRGAEPVPGVTLVTPNADEARRAAPSTQDDLRPDVLAGVLREHWDVGAVCVTSGATGAFVTSGGPPLYVPAPTVDGGDPCGAGDRLTAAVAVALARGSSVEDAVGAGVAAASAWVADGGAEGFRRRAGGGAVVGTGVDAGNGVHAGNGTHSGDGRHAEPAARAPRLTVADDGASLEAVAHRLRAGGRTLVATGGCFDIVHAGHVATLQAARRLGDALVVLVNSDASVRRLKGPGRPVVTARDRARVLEAFDCVDAVVVFDEDTPEHALARLRPDVWAKGGDYVDVELPEAAVVRRHGGRVVLLPHLGGRSTTSIIERSRTA